MMSNYSSTTSTNPLAKEAELKAFESNFFPAGGAPHLSNIPQAPPAPKNLGHIRSKPVHLKTRNWGPKLENGFAGINRSLYDRPNVFYWDSTPTMTERPHLEGEHRVAPPSISRGVSSNIPQAPPAPRFHKLRSDGLINGRRLRLRNWGHPTKRGWSRMNKDLYKSGLNLERNVILNELWAKFQSRGLVEEAPREIIQMPTVVDVPTPITTTTTTTVVDVPTPITTSYVAPVAVPGPVQVLQTTVPVPMLNPPLNDGRRYNKLYDANTAARNNKKGLSSLVKRRGTRRDHLVQPSIGALPATSLTTPVVPMSAPVPLPSTAPLSKRQLKRQNKLAKKNGGRLPGTGLNGGILPSAGLGGGYLPTQTLGGGFMPTQGFAGGYLPTQTLGGGFMPTQGLARGVLPTTTGIAPVNTLLTPGAPLGAGVPAPSVIGQGHRVRRARRAKKAGSINPTYGNVISATPGPILTEPAVFTTTTIVPVQQFVKQEYITQPLAPLAMGNPIM